MHGILLAVVTTQGKTYTVRGGENMFGNLRAEMARIPISGRVVADTVGITPSSFYDKMAGRTEFKRSEMALIRNQFFKEFTVDFLFDVQACEEVN